MRRLYGSLVLAAGFLVTWSAAGCGPSRYVNETLYGPTRMPATHDEPLEIPDVGPEDFNGVALADAPAGVRAAFRQGHRSDGAVAVTSVNQQLQPTGLIVYDVTYVANGTPARTVYLADGTDVTTTYDTGTAWARSVPADAVDRARREAAAKAVAAAAGAPTTRPTTRQLE